LARDIDSSWEAVVLWAQSLADEVALDQPAQHVAVFVHDATVGSLRLVGQVWGAGENTGEVAVGRWLVPLEGSVCGRVFRTGEAALCADVGLDPDYRRFPGGASRSSLTVPLRDEGGAVGVITVEAPWISAFSIADYERLTNIATRAAAGMPPHPTGS
jgi:GAF domain-containing protein